MPESKLCIVIYRGSLERSRLAFLLDGIAPFHSKLIFVWIFPGTLSEKVKQILRDFITPYNLCRIEVLNHTFKQFFRTRNALNSLATEYSEYNLALIGDSASLWAASFKPQKLWWFVNGIPEEAALHNGWKVKLQSRVQWWLYANAVKPDLIVTVSQRMSAHIKQYFSHAAILAMPTCVDVSVFGVSGSGKPMRSGVFVYLGTGAPWQSLNQLSVLWEEIHKLDPKIRFRVISRDPRCKVLSSGIATSQIEFCSSNDFKEVASYLHDAEAGFLIRRDHIVNRVSFPTKLGEYVASGCWVVVSELDWDVSDYVNEFGVGFNAPVSEDARDLARKILEFRNNLNWNILPENITACANALDRKLWTNRLRLSLMGGAGLT